VEIATNRERYVVSIEQFFPKLLISTYTTHPSLLRTFENTTKSKRKSEGASEGGREREKKRTRKKKKKKKQSVRAREMGVTLLS
jgi:hypothetical protein